MHRTPEVEASHHSNPADPRLGETPTVDLLTIRSALRHDLFPPTGIGGEPGQGRPNPKAGSSFAGRIQPSAFNWHDTGHLQTFRKNQLVHSIRADGGEALLTPAVPA
jgi:hypothetical protein